MVYGETAANEDLVKESGKLTPRTTFKNSRMAFGIDKVFLFKLDNHQSLSLQILAGL